MTTFLIIAAVILLAIVLGGAAMLVWKIDAIIEDIHE